MNHDHIQSLVHVGTLALAMLAHSSGMTAGHEDEDEDEDKQQSENTDGRSGVVDVCASVT